MSNMSSQSFKSGHLSKINMNLSGQCLLRLRDAVRAGSAILFVLMAVCVVSLTGCGSSGYAGGGIVSLSASSVTLDAGQAFMVTSKLSGSPTVSWSLSGASCTGSACGTLSGAQGVSITYTAPTGVTTPLALTLTAAVTGTKNQSTVSITVNPAPTLSGTPPAGTVGVAYTTTLTATGGTAPLKLSISAGSLPAGLTFNATTGVISGTPTTIGTSSFTVQVSDASDVPNSVTIPETITISNQGAALTILGGNPPAGTVGIAYTTALNASGGTAPYTWSIVSGALPSGLTLSASTGVIAGIPTAQGTSTFTAQVQDASGSQSSKIFSITINAGASQLTLTITTLPGGTVGVPYTGTIGVSGGTPPYSCVITAGTLPAGLSLNGCVVSGTPTTPGTSTITVTVTDSGNPKQTTTGPVTITISPAALTLTLTSLPNATVGTPYTATIGVAGGTAPYNCVITAGTLPAGLSLAGCVVSGTPTVAGTVNLTVKATDSSSPVETTTGPVSLTVLPASNTLTLTNPPNATINTPYTGTIGVSGGTAPYTCTITAGTLPTGLTASGCIISGTPTVSGSVTITVHATDSSSPAKTTTGPVTITVLPASVTLTLGSLPNATVDTPYTGTIGVSGGTAPYTCTITAGTLPTGLTAAGCVVSGTPTTAGTSTVTVKVTDSASPSASTTGPVSITVLPISALALTGSLPNATLQVAYTQTLQATGGVAPYTYVVTAGTLPAGLNLSTAGVISGTPTAVGASSFTVTVTDSEPTPKTATNAYVLLVVYPVTPNDSEFKGPYAYLFQGYDDVLVGVLAYQTGTVGSFTADGTGGINSGELDSNHQSSAPAGATISTNTFIGTYTIGTDSRGSLTITTFNADGTTDQTSTYAIALKAPVSPSTISTHGDMIESDSNNLQGTRGSGTILAQDNTSFAAGLTGSYAFGFQGDTPCLIACTIGITGGPVASVGQFTATAGSISSGMSDSNIATSNYPSESLSGSYEPADGNGRLALAMTTAGTPTGVYPTDYAAYMVNANESLVLSTDKHSSYILLAGTAQLQTQSSFSTSSLSGPIIGYENAQADPGLLGTTLQGVLNFSTSTIFRATANAAGTCNTTNVDVAGVTGLVNQLVGGLLSTLTGNDLSAILGTYQSTGTSNCSASGTNGRGVFDYPNPSGLLVPVLQLLGLDKPPAPRVFYLVAPNQGYFLETSYAGLGNFEPQVGAPFSAATFDGTFVYGTAPAASLASINSSGVITSNGTGTANATLDENIGLGTINLIQLGTTSTLNYTLTDATAGRYTAGTVVFYAINPSRFVLMDTNPLTTSPSVVVLY